MLGRVRTSWQTWRTGNTRHEEKASQAVRERSGERRRHNLFEAAAVYVAARAEGDQQRADEASGWVDPGALAFGVDELAQRAIVALARERDVTPRDVARSLLGLPAA
ncbi:hypothetical protein GTW43_15080 [Streptomyces sp. SID5785]|uniref:hypothetical protein n=1 Tax=Streptomyces sp. SID5785 TaxID=2690309 RepID=UPI0013618323|nr:hypothetical protein [Streptomyces sp. SID5785]MZD06410.1 hypothetical protein [Streptomyces sp. SID5785]